MSELTRIEKQIARLQKRAETIRKKEIKNVLASIVSQMRKFDISPEELANALGKRRLSSRTTRAATAKKQARTPIEPKYRDPETQATWTGRGRTPRWIVDAEAKGTSRDSFLIQAPVDSGTSQGEDDTQT